MKKLLDATAIVLAAHAAEAQQNRIASDFEVARMERQLASSRDFLGQLSARLNLGDVRAARREPALARAEYERALSLAETERRDARTASDLARYATATSYAGLAQAKLGRAPGAFALLEESLRVAGDNAKTWNLYSSAMSVLGLSSKAVATAKGAVRIAQRELAAEPGLDRRLDLAVYQHALAAAMISNGQAAEAERELVALTESLAAPAFDSLRREAARAESFEVFSTARGDVAAYLSLFNRAHLRLASLYEQRGARELAIRTYRRVLEGRTDDATALAALARLAGSADERERRYVEAFDANPFSPSLIRDYRTNGVGTPAAREEATTDGAKMRRALSLAAAGQTRAAREQLDDLLARHPDNTTLIGIVRELDGGREAAMSIVPGATPTSAELRRLVDALTADRLTPDDRSALDAMQFTSIARFDEAQDSPLGQTVLATGSIEGVAFRFAQPTAFTGTFDTSIPLRLTYRVLGTARNGDADVLLLEPVRLEVAR